MRGSATAASAPRDADGEPELRAGREPGRTRSRRASGSRTPRSSPPARRRPAADDHARTGRPGAASAESSSPTATRLARGGERLDRDEELRPARAPLARREEVAQVAGAEEQRRRVELDEQPQRRPAPGRSRSRRPGRNARARRRCSGPSAISGANCRPSAAPSAAPAEVAQHVEVGWRSAPAGSSARLRARAKARGAQQPPAANAATPRSARLQRGDGEEAERHVAGDVHRDVEAR